MRAPHAAAALAFVVATFVGLTPQAQFGLAPQAQVSTENGFENAFDVSLGGTTALARGRARVTNRGRGRAAAAVRGKIAVQPIDGPTGMESMRGLVVRIVRGRGYRTMTSLPRYEGTGQYPGLAKDHHLAAFVTADVEERGKWQRITFLVWNGSTGSILGRWTASGQAPVLARAVGRGFWAHLGPAVMKAEAPQSDTLDAAPTMRIDASDQAMDDRRDDFPVAQR